MYDYEKEQYRFKKIKYGLSMAFFGIGSANLPKQFPSYPILDDIIIFIGFGISLFLAYRFVSLLRTGQ